MFNVSTTATNCPESTDYYYWICVAIFLYMVLHVIYLIIRQFYVFVIGWIFVKNRLKKFGKWASNETRLIFSVYCTNFICILVITGCTGGLGTEFCHQLASLGFNLFITDKTDESVLSNFAHDLGKLQDLLIVISSKIQKKMLVFFRS